MFSISKISSRWTSIYPIYIDAKRSYGQERRIARDKAVWWPLSKDIAQAAVNIGIQCLHESNKNHPRDWENPGRVKVLWKKDGRLVYPRAKTSASDELLHSESSCVLF